MPSDPPSVVYQTVFDSICTRFTPKDLADNGVEIELMHMGSSFDVSAFYQVRRHACTSGHSILYVLKGLYILTV